MEICNSYKEVLDLLRTQSENINFKYSRKYHEFILNIKSMRVLVKLDDRVVYDGDLPDYLQTGKFKKYHVLDEALFLIKSLYNIIVSNSKSYAVLKDNGAIIFVNKDYLAKWIRLVKQTNLSKECKDKWIDYGQHRLYSDFSVTSIYEYPDSMGRVRFDYPIPNYSDSELKLCVEELIELIRDNKDKINNLNADIMNEIENRYNVCKSMSERYEHKIANMDIKLIKEDEKKFYLVMSNKKRVLKLPLKYPEDIIKEDYEYTKDKTYLENARTIDGYLIRLQNWWRLVQSACYDAAIITFRDGDTITVKYDTPLSEITDTPHEIKKIVKMKEPFNIAELPYYCKLIIEEIGNNHIKVKSLYSKNEPVIQIQVPHSYTIMLKKIGVKEGVTYSYEDLTFMLLVHYVYCGGADLPKCIKRELLPFTKEV